MRLTKLISSLNPKAISLPRRGGKRSPGDESVREGVLLKDEAIIKDGRMIGRRTLTVTKDGGTERWDTYFWPRCEQIYVSDNLRVPE